jgi:TPR repeat protein
MCINSKEFQQIKQQANAGDAYSQTLLGKFYEVAGDILDGSLYNLDYKEAAKWYKKTAEQEYAAAQTELGELHYCGNGVLEDYKEAFDLWTKASVQGYAEAKYWLGVMYCNGDGVPQNYEEAVEWFKKAAEQGHSKAQYSLGVMNAKGLGVLQNYEETVKWYKRKISNRPRQLMLKKLTEFCKPS